MTSCRRAKKWIEEQSEGRLGVEDALQLDAHVAECSACREHRAREQSLVDALERLPAPAIERLDLDASLRQIHARLDAEPKRAPRTSLRAWQRVAAALFLIGVSAWGWSHLASRSAETDGRAGTQALAPSVARTAPQPIEAPAVEQSTPGSLVVGVARPTDLDPERLAHVREQVAEALLRSHAAHANGGDAAFLDGLEAEIGALGLDDWPWRRIVASLVERDADHAAAALRYLGARGDATAVAAIAPALHDAATRPAATTALLACGPLGLDALAVAVRHEDVRVQVLEHVRTLDGAVATRWLRRGLQQGADTAVCSALVAELAHQGALGAQVLLDLAPRVDVPRAALIAAFVASDPEGDVLVERLEALPTQLALELVAELHPADALPWVSQVAREMAQHAPDALRVLATFDGSDPLRELLTFAPDRENEAWLERAWGEAVAHDPERLVALVEQLRGTADPSVLHRLLDQLVFCEDPRVVPAVLALCRGSLLSRDDRERAVLATGEIGDSAQVAALATFFGTLTRDDASLAAACLMAAHAIGDAGAAAQLLTEVRESKRQRLLRLVSRFRGRSRQSVSLFRIAHELRTCLPDHVATTGSLTQ